MTWTAFYQADDEMRHEIATTNFEWSAEHQREKFVAKMTNPNAQIFWTWVEPTAIKNLDDLGEENNEGLPEPVKETADAVMKGLGIVWGNGPEGPLAIRRKLCPTK